MLTGKERVRKVLKGEKPDRCPVTALLSVVGAKMAGFSIKEFEEESEKYYEGHMIAYLKFRPDILILHLNVLSEVEALGTRVDRDGGGPPRPRNLILEKKGDLGKLSIPDPDRERPFNVYLEAGEKLVKEIRDTSCSLGFMSPWTTAINMRGAENLLRDSYRDPEYVHEILRFTTEYAKKIALSISARGLGLSMSDSGGSLNLVSPSIYRKFVRPYNKEVIGYLKQKKISLGLHACGFNDPIIEDIISLEPLTLSIDAPTSLKKTLALSKNRVTVLGNVDTSLFVFGSNKVIEAEVKKCLNAAAQTESYNFILCSGCDLPFIAEIEKIEAYFEAAKRHGIYAD